jgi:hypothetical protein
VKNQLGTAALLIGLLLPVTAARAAVSNSDENANEFARRVLTNEVTAEAQDHSHWMCRLETDTSHGKEVYEVVEAKSGDLKSLVLRNGRPLSLRQKREEDARIQKLIHNPEALQSSMKKENEDEEQSQRLLKLLPDALIFKFGERRGDMVELQFSPNPKFHPPSREAEVLRALEGTMWVNSKQSRLVELNGRLSREVKFGGGMLGHLNKGGEFHVKQAEVGPGYWELTLLNVNMHGKALFFKTINVQQKMRRTDFHRIPDDLTLAQAADLLQKQNVVAQRGSPASK